MQKQILLKKFPITLYKNIFLILYNLNCLATLVVDVPELDNNKAVFNLFYLNLVFLELCSNFMSFFACPAIKSLSK